jgi:hypothetical protein
MEPVRALLYQYGASMDLSLKPAESSKHILSSGYELSSELIAMVKDESSGEVNENPYFHLCEFEQICACLHIESMSYETLRWKLFPSSLIGKSKHWYRRHVKRSKGNWKALSSSFCLQFFFPFIRLSNFVQNF